MWSLLRHLKSSSLSRTRQCTFFFFNWYSSQSYPLASVLHPIPLSSRGLSNNNSNTSLLFTWHERLNPFWRKSLLSFSLAFLQMAVSLYPFILREVLRHMFSMWFWMLMPSEYLIMYVMLASYSVTLCFLLVSMETRRDERQGIKRQMHFLAVWSSAWSSLVSLESWSLSGSCYTRAGHTQTSWGTEDETEHEAAEGSTERMMKKKAEEEDVHPVCLVFFIPYLSVVWFLLRMYVCIPVYFSSLPSLFLLVSSEVMPSSCNSLLDTKHQLCVRRMELEMFSTPHFTWWVHE